MSGAAHSPVSSEAGVLSAASLKRIDREVAKYPADQKQSAVMAALAIAQDEKTWLAPGTMQTLILNLPSGLVWYML